MVCHLKSHYLARIAVCTPISGSLWRSVFRKPNIMKDMAIYPALDPIGSRRIQGPGLDLDLVSLIPARLRCPLAKIIKGGALIRVKRAGEMLCNESVSVIIPLLSQGPPPISEVVSYGFMQVKVRSI